MEEKNGVHEESEGNDSITAGIQNADADNKVRNSRNGYGNQIEEDDSVFTFGKSVRARHSVGNRSNKPTAKERIEAAGKSIRESVQNKEMNNLKVDGYTSVSDTKLAFTDERIDTLLGGGYYGSTNHDYARSRLLADRIDEAMNAIQGKTMNNNKVNEISDIPTFSETNIVENFGFSRNQMKEWINGNGYSI